jgi:hypothetical protein
VAWTLICFNVLVAVAVIILMQFYDTTFPIFVMSYTLILSASFALSFFDMIYRLCTCQYCFQSTSDDEMIKGGDDDGVGVIEDEPFICSPTSDDIGSDDDYVTLNNDEQQQQNMKKKKSKVMDSGASDTEESSTTTTEEDATVSVSTKKPQEPVATVAPAST